MAQLGRAQPIRPHLASGRVVAPGGPVVPDATVLEQNEPRHSRYERRGAPRAHLSGPIVTGASTPPVAVPRIHTFEWDQSLWRTQVGRTVPKPHLAHAVAPWLALQPVISGITRVAHTTLLRSFERRGRGQWRLPQPVVAPGGPVVPGITEILVIQSRRDHRDRVASDRRFWPTLLQPIQPALVTQGLFVTGLSSARRTFERRGAPHPHLSPPIVVPTMGGAQPFPINQRSGLFSNTPILLRRYKTIPVVAPGTPVVPGATITLQDKWRALTGRTIPKPHTALGIVAPGHVVIAASTVLLVTVNKRTLVLRNAPHPHLAPRTLIQPPSTNPLPPAIIVSQSKRRPHVGRTTPHPHLPPANLTPGPFRPGQIVGQARPRMHIGRRGPSPHTSPPVVTPIVAGTPPFPPAIVLSQARARALVGRHITQPDFASPLAAAPAPPELVAFTAQVAAPRWTAYVGDHRWASRIGPARWSTSVSQPRWTGEVKRFA